MNTKETNTTNLPRVIDCDLIASLKHQGKHEQAEQLLKAFHADVKKAGRQAKREVMAQDRQIKKFHGVCMMQSCKEPTEEGHVNCIFHREQKRLFTMNKIKKGICIHCQKKVSKGHHQCRFHLLKYRKYGKEHYNRDKAHDYYIKSRDHKISKGICLCCDQKSLVGKTMCDLHLKTHQKKAREHYRQNKELHKTNARNRYKENKQQKEMKNNEL